MTSTVPPGPADPWSAPGYAAAGHRVEPGGPGAFAPGPWQAASPRPPTSLRGLGNATAVLLGLQVVLGLVTAVVSGWGVLRWSRVSGAPVTMTLAPDAAQATLLLVRTPLTLLTAVLFVCWLGAATRNAREAGSRVRHAPAWAVFSWLVPFLSLWRPKQMVDDVWRASAPGVPPGTDLRQVQKSSLVFWWWAAFLVGGALPAVGVFRSLQASVGPNLVATLRGEPAPFEVDYARVHETAALWNLWGALVLLVCAGLAVVIVLRVSRWQDARRTTG